MKVFKQNSGLIAVLSDAISEGIIIINNKQKIVATNKATNELFGYANDTLIGKHLNTLIPKKHHAVHKGHFKKFIEKDQKRQMGDRRDLYGVRQGGSEFSVEVSLNSFEIYGDSYVMAVVIDVTERKNYTMRLERAVENRTAVLKEALEREYELNEIKSRFVAMASHEFRTPLTAIITSTNLIRKYHDLKVYDKQEKHLDRITASARNLVAILDDFLSLEKIESDQMYINPTEIDFREYIKDILIEVGPWAKEKQEVVHRHSGVNKICIDQSLTRNILLNLLSNSLKYSPKQSIVKLITSIIDKNLVIKIVDKGIGIPKEDQKNMFSQFYRASNVNEINGTGLGLTIVKRYLKMLGGDIDFSSEEGKGTTFNVYIPIT